MFATQQLVAPRTPGWVRYLNQRLPGEVPHPDDQFFNGIAIGGTAVTGSGTATWSQRYGRLSVVANGNGGSALAARAYPITSASAPMTIETHVAEGVNAGNQAPALFVGFSNGTATSSNIFGFMNYTSGFYNLSNTFASLGYGTNVGLAQPVTGRYMRVSWSASNTFKWQYSHDGVSWTKRTSTTFSVTLSPTHFWVAAQQNPATDATVGWDYIRVASTDLIP